MTTVKSKSFSSVSPHLVLALCLVLPALVLMWRFAHPTGMVSQALGMHNLPHRLQRHVENLMLVPLGAVVVVFFRLTLGFRMLGLFRPILLAMAFRSGGVKASLLFLAVTLCVIALVRPMVAGMHSYARLAIILMCIAGLMMTVLIVGQSWQLPVLARLAYFPIIALCLTSESFAAKMRSKGTGEAFGRVAATAVGGLAIGAISQPHGLLRGLAAHPEMLMMLMGCVIAIDRWLRLRLLSAARWSGPLAMFSALFAAPAEEAAVD